MSFVVRSALIVVAVLEGGCGHKGPPLPPLIKLPTAPELKAERRGSRIDLQLTVPSANTDGTRPANIERVDVYGLTGPVSMSDAELMARGEKVGSVEVKTPRDPDRTIEPGEPESDLDPLTGKGLDQGSQTHLEEQLTAALASRAVDADAGGPLLGPLAAASSRVYVGVAVARNGRKGPPSKRVTVPLGPAPPPPSSAAVSYDETAITVAWTPPQSPPEESSSGVLPSRQVWPVLPSLAFNVYDASGEIGTLLTKTPVTEPRFQDTRVEWGAERCYSVRTVQTVADVTVESEAQPRTCAKLVDTFPPAAPKTLQAVPTDGAIHLIWAPNTEKDLAGYIILRGVAPAEHLEPITSTPIQEVTFNDGVRAGVRYVYAVRAVDKAGNQSQLSNRVEETAR